MSYRTIAPLSGLQCRVDGEPDCTRSITICVKLSDEEIARAFCDRGDRNQAVILNKIADEFRAYPMQRDYIAMVDGEGEAPDGRGGALPGGTRVVGAGVAERTQTAKGGCPMSYYAHYHLTVDGRPVEASGSRTDEHAAQVRAAYWNMRDRLAELKQTHGCGDRPGIEAFNG